MYYWAWSLSEYFLRCALFYQDKPQAATKKKTLFMAPRVVRIVALTHHDSAGK